MCQLHHIAYEEKAGRTWEGGRRGAGKELIEILQQSRFNYWMKELKKTKVKRMNTNHKNPFDQVIKFSGVIVHVLKKCPIP